MEWLGHPRVELGRERRVVLERRREDIDNVIDELDELEQRCERLLAGSADTPREVASP